MRSAESASLSPEEIVAALNRQIERHETLAAGLREIGDEDDAAEALATMAELRAVRDGFLSWLVARAYRHAPGGQAFTFRRRKIVD